MFNNLAKRRLNIKYTLEFLSRVILIEPGVRGPDRLALKVAGWVTWGQHRPSFITYVKQRSAFIRDLRAKAPTESHFQY